MKDLKLALSKHQLRVKVKTLAEEANIIRKEEARTWGSFKDSLINHRRWDVRNEARATQLAVRYLSNGTYQGVEKDVKEGHKFEIYIVPRVIAIVKKYGTGNPNEVKDKILGWVRDPESNIW